MEEVVMKRFITVSMIFVILVFMSAALSADEAAREISAILSGIRQEQGVTSNGDINPDKVSDDLLAELGEAVMEVNHPNERQHEWMDEMMGGEGSQSLRSAHIMMGYNYLSGTGWRRGPYGGRGMMNDGLFMPMMGGYDGYGHMTGRGFFGWGWIGMVIVLLLVAGGIAGIIVAITRRNGTTSGGAVSGIDILKQRLAKGDITKEEFDKLKHDVT